MATRDDAAQGARVVISAVINRIADGALEIGAATPVVAPLCVALLEVKKVVDGASRNGEKLEELWGQCDLITVQVIDKAKASPTSTIDVKPLQECVEKLREVAKRYHDRGRIARLAQFHRDGDDIERLRTRISAVVQIMGLSGVVNIMARLQPRPELAPVPKNAVVTKSSHVVRGGVVDRVCKILGGDGGPAVAALTGHSGAGKTTAAAAMVGKRGDRLRALFPRGVVWLRVGKGAGAADRLPGLMLTLAKRLHQDVMKGGVDAPAGGEDRGSYVTKIVSQEKLKCLVVADDVWENEVVEMLRETGMWVLLTTRFPEFVEPQERVVVDTLMPAEAEDVLRGVAELQSGERLCDAAMEVVEICGRVAMDTAFVGSWICQVESNRKEDEWTRAVAKIKDQGGGVATEREVNRLAILRAGFDYLGAENVFAQKLYAKLAVFPDGHAFGESDAAVLLGDEQAVTTPMSILERWGVLKADALDKYRMHDAHADFAREELMDSNKNRKLAVERWTAHISRLDFAFDVDTYTLLTLWRALERVGGKGWFRSRPYDEQLLEMDVTNPSKAIAVQVVALLYGQERNFRELDAITEKVLQQCDGHHGDCCPGLRMIALYFTSYSLGWQGRLKECEDVDRQLSEMTGPDSELRLPNEGAGVLRMAATLNMHGLHARAVKRPHDAEKWLRKTVEVLETGGLVTS